MKEYHREYCVLSPTGTPSNHHYTDEGLLGERVTKETATHVIVHYVDVVKL